MNFNSENYNLNLFQSNNKKLNANAKFDYFTV